MLQTKDAHKYRVYVQTKKGKIKKHGRVHNVVFHPSKPRAIGLTIKRPDIALMVKRDDSFVALDSISYTEDGNILVDASDKGAWGSAACKRLGVDLDECIIWDYMPVVNLEGVELGTITNIVLNESAKIESIDISSGDINRALLGSADIVVERLRGYDHNRGAIVADVQPEDVEVSGGVAGKAGEAWAKGTHAVSQGQNAISERAAENIEQTAYAAGEAIAGIKEKVGAKAKESGLSEKTADLGTKAEDALSEGAFKLGQAIGNLRNTGETVAAEAVEVKTVAEGASKVEEAVAKKAAAAKKEADQDTDFDAAAKAVGNHLKKTRGMFSAFKEEFDKASK